MSAWLSLASAIAAGVLAGHHLLPAVYTLARNWFGERRADQGELGQEVEDQGARVDRLFELMTAARLKIDELEARGARDGGSRARR